MGWPSEAREPEAFATGQDWLLGGKEGLDEKVGPEISQKMNASVENRFSTLYSVFM